MATRKAAKKSVKKSARRVPAKKAGKQVAKKTTRASAAKAADTKAAKKTGVRKAAKTATAKKSASTQAGARKVAKKQAVKKSGARKVAKTPPTGAASRKTASRKTASTKKVAKRRAGITPEQALANTRALLAAKQAHDRETPPWQLIGGGDGGAPHEGFQSDAARDRAAELHEGEMHLHAIQGSVSSSGRRKQGRRDSREGT